YSSGSENAYGRRSVTLSRVRLRVAYGPSTLVGYRQLIERHGKASKTDLPIDALSEISFGIDALSQSRASASDPVDLQGHLHLRLSLGGDRAESESTCKESPHAERFYRARLPTQIGLADEPSPNPVGLWCGRGCDRWRC